MSATCIPEQFQATGTDVAVSITRAVTQHRIGCALVFDGRLDPDRLRRAVRLSLDAEPILGCSYQTGAYRAVWRRLEDLDDAVPFSMLESDDPVGATTAFQAAQVDDAGPQAAVSLVRSAERDHLAIKLSHVLADGQAAKQYAYLLAHIYTKLGADPSYSPKPNTARRPTARDVWDNLTPEQRKSAKNGKSWARPTWEIPTRAHTGKRLTYRTTVFEPPSFFALKEYGKQRGATVNDMLLAAFFRASVRAFDPPSGVPLSLMCTVDHRRYLTNADRLPIANISISGSLDIERADGEDFDDTLRRVRERMAAWAETCYGAGPALNAEKMTVLGYGITKRLVGAALKMAARSGKTYAYLTNIGILDEARLGFDGCVPVAAHMFGPAAIGASVVQTVSTYRSALAICMGFCEADCDAAMIERVLRSTTNELPAAD